MFLSAIVSLSLKIVHTGNIVQTVIPDECSAFVVCPIRNMFTYGFACWRERHIMLRIHFRNRVKRARSTHVVAQESSIRNIWNDVNFLYFDFCRFRGMRQNRSLSKDRGRFRRATASAGTTTSGAGTRLAVSVLVRMRRLPT